MAKRKPFGLGDLTRYPLFTKEFLAWLKQSIPPAQQDRIIYTAHIRGKKDGRA